MPTNYDTLSEAIEGMKAQGYTEDFNLMENCIECQALDLKIAPSDFEVDQVFRFEGMTNPADSSVLYAISSERENVKGLLVDAYGTYADAMSRELVEKLRYEPN